jgi:NAD(P)-dependent dehydrogenase (short-subunit alcohol dehydrogenase family)
MKYDGKVALITGAGAGIGRIYALFFAQRGAKVVVNDMNAKAGQSVVDEITKAGGVAVLDNHSVVDGEKVVATCLEKFGGVHIIVNNAGVLRDVSFQKQTPEQWDLVVQVHLYGTRNICKAAWKTMNQQKYGRIINVTSVNGLYGQYGQSNYSGAKMGIVGFSKTLALEGAKKNIKVNVLAPGAGTAMTATVMPKAIVDAWKPELVCPIVAFLAHEECPVTGNIYESGGGWVAQVKWMRTQGHYFDVDATFGPEEIRDKFANISDWKGADFPDDTAQDSNPLNNKQLKQIIAKLQAAGAKAKKSKL